MVPPFHRGPTAFKGTHCHPPIFCWSQAVQFGVGRPFFFFSWNVSKGDNTLTKNPSYHSQNDAQTTKFMSFHHHFISFHYHSIIIPLSFHHHSISIIIPSSYSKFLKTLLFTEMLRMPGIFHIRCNKGSRHFHHRNKVGTSTRVPASMRCLFPSSTPWRFCPRCCRMTCHDWWLLMFFVMIWSYVTHCKFHYAIYHYLPMLSSTTLQTSRDHLKSKMKSNEDQSPCMQGEGHSCCKRGKNPNLARGLHPWHVLQTSTLACANWCYLDLFDSANILGPTTQAFSTARCTSNTQIPQGNCQSTAQLLMKSFKALGVARQTCHNLGDQFPTSLLGLVGAASLSLPPIHPESIWSI